MDAIAFGVAAAISHSSVMVVEDHLGHTGLRTHVHAMSQTRFTGPFARFDP